MNPTIRRYAAPLAVAALALGLAACSEEPKPTSLLSHVPVDTPYVFATSEPLPEPLYGKLMAISQGQMDEVVQRVRELAALRQQPSTDASKPSLPLDDTSLRVVEALAAEFEGKFTTTGMGELGFNRDADSVIYGLSLFPAMRAEVADPAKVEALLTRIEQRSGATAPRVERPGGSLRRIPLADGQLLLIVALLDKQLVLGLLPASGEQQLLPVLLGETVPKTSLADAGGLAALQERYGYSGYGEGYLDTQALARLLTGRSSGEYDAVLHALLADVPQPPAACQGLIDKLVAGVPRLTVGFTDVSNDGYGLTAAYETSPVVSAALQKLAKPQPLPGLGVASDTLFSMGLDLDMAALREGIKSLLRFVAREGQGCDGIDADAIQAAVPNVDFVLGPMSAGLSGFYTELAELRFDPDSGQPTAVRGGLLVAVSDPRGVLAMAAMMNPELAQLELPQDGSAVAVPAELLPPDVPPLYLAAGDGLLALAVGEDGDQRAAAMLKAESSPTPLLLGVDYDAARILAPMAQVMSLLADQLDASGQVEQAAAMREQAQGMSSAAGQFGRVQVSLAPDARGLVMQQRVALP